MGNSMSKLVQSVPRPWPPINHPACHFIPLPQLPTVMESGNDVQGGLQILWPHRGNCLWRGGVEVSVYVPGVACFLHLKVTISFLSGYHLHYNSQTERLNQDIGRFLCFCWLKTSRTGANTYHGQNMLFRLLMGLTVFQCVLCTEAFSRTSVWNCHHEN